MESKHYKYCLHCYLEEYERTTAELNSLSRQKNVEQEAQKAAIKQSFTKAMRHFPNDSIADLWKSIYRAHLYHKSGLSDIEVIQKAISADQSWKKSSGHAFEETVKELGNLALEGTDIEIVLQRDLSTLIKAGEIANEPRDISWLKEQINANIFDLYCLVHINTQKYCFGCLQAKTSIRDRVTRDREPSIHAMQSFFWSAILVLDGDFLRLPKFINMANGGSTEFPNNGWHGMYVLSFKETNNRIYPLSIDFNTFKSHALQAAEQWTKNRQWLDSTWKAD